MSTAQTWETTSTDLGDTLKLAEQIGHKLRGGEVVELIGDLGAGKTAFVRGLAKGMGSQDVVRSPSFTLGNQYKGSELTLYHFDFHRLNAAGIMRDELAEILTDPQAVVAIEWADLIEDLLPAERLIVRLQAVGDDRRQFKLEYPDNLSYLVDTSA
jgi:tRNA threonylcarbamoyladenosine biosynthesis protein TsaE